MIYLIVTSINQPTLCPNASWNLNGTTFASSSTVSTYPYGLFVNTNNAVYVAATSLNRIQMWSAGSVSPTRNITGGLNSPRAVCVTVNGDIYVDNGNNGQVTKWASNATSGVWAMSVPGRCMGLYVDTNYTLYCSIDGSQRVIAMSLKNSTNTATTVAGTGAAGATSTTLHFPNGIVVDINFNLYVADWGNNRIQKFMYNQLSATTVAGTGAPGTITLNGPTDVAVDANGYLFIADYSNNRIVGSGPNGFRCVIGCSGSSGSSASQLLQPQNVGFDSYGNNRIQMFLLTNNTCTTSG